MPLDDLYSFGEMAEMIIGGWRYLVSSSYRQKKHREWREQSWVGMPFDVAFGLFGIILSLGLLGIVAAATWSFLNH